MAITFNHNLFGTVTSKEITSNFENPPDVTDDSCDPVWDDETNLWTWDKPLGTCGQVVTRDDDKIKIAMTLEITGETYNAIAATLFTLQKILPARVHFICEFDAILSVSGDEVAVKPPQLISDATSIIAPANTFEVFLTLKYYSDDSFTTELDYDKTVFIGQDLYVQFEWDLPKIKTLRFVVHRCTITDGTNSINIIDQACYSQLIGAQPFGEAAGASLDAKAVQSKSSFKYTSFLMSAENHSDQELECSITFCVIHDDNAL